MCYRPLYVLFVRLLIQSMCSVNVWSEKCWRPSSPTNVLSHRSPTPTPLREVPPPWRSWVWDSVVFRPRPPPLSGTTVVWNPEIEDFGNWLKVTSSLTPDSRVQVEGKDGKWSMHCTTFKDLERPWVRGIDVSSLLSRMEFSQQLFLITEFCTFRKPDLCLVHQFSLNEHGTDGKCHWGWE